MNERPTPGQLFALHEENEVVMTDNVDKAGDDSWRGNKWTRLFPFCKTWSVPSDILQPQV